MFDNLIDSSVGISCQTNELSITIRDGIGNVLRDSRPLCQNWQLPSIRLCVIDRQSWLAWWKCEDIRHLSSCLWSTDCVSAKNTFLFDVYWCITALNSSITQVISFEMLFSALTLLPIGWEESIVFNSINRKMQFIHILYNIIIYLYLIVGQSWQRFMISITFEDHIDSIQSYLTTAKI